MFTNFCPNVRHRQSPFNMLRPRSDAIVCSSHSSIAVFGTFARCTRTNRPVPLHGEFSSGWLTSSGTERDL